MYVVGSARQTSHSTTSAELSTELLASEMHFFWLPAAGIRVTGGSPFSQIKRTKQQKHSGSLAGTMKRINQTNSETIRILRGRVRQRREVYSGFPWLFGSSCFGSSQQFVSFFGWVRFEGKLFPFDFPCFYFGLVEKKLFSLSRLCGFLMVSFKERV